MVFFRLSGFVRESLIQKPSFGRIDQFISKVNLVSRMCHSGEGRYLQWDLIRRVISDIKLEPKESVLHVGCGSGEETKSIATEVGSVTG